MPRRGTHKNLAVAVGVAAGRAAVEGTPMTVWHNRDTKDESNYEVWPEGVAIVLASKLLTVSVVMHDKTVRVALD